MANQGIFTNKKPVNKVFTWNLLTSKTSKYKRGGKLRACSGIKYAKDNIKQSKINEHETPLDEILYDQFSVGENMDKHFWRRKLCWAGLN